MAVIKEEDILDFELLSRPKPISCETPNCEKPHHLMGLCWYCFIFQD